MVLDFISGSIVSQDTLAGELRTDPVVGITYIDFMSVPFNRRGYQSTLETDSTLDELRQRNFKGDAIIMLIWFDARHAYGHYVVMTGYNETGIFVNDPWPSNWTQPSGRSTGRNAFVSYVLLADLWEISERWALFVPTSTTVTVTVQDLFGISVGGARVRISSPNGDPQEQLTDNTGMASFASVPRGKFSISVTSLGVTTQLEGDTALSREVTVTVFVSVNTVFATVVVAWLFLLTAHRTKGKAPGVEGQPPVPPATVGTSLIPIFLLRRRLELGCGSCQERPRFLRESTTKSLLWGPGDGSRGTHPNKEQARNLPVQRTAARSARRVDPA